VTAVGGPLYLKDPQTSRFVSGDLEEAELLLGSPLPVLPPPEMEGGRPAFFTKFHPRVRTLTQRFLQSLLTQIGAPLNATKAQSDAGARDGAEYEAVLGRMLRAARANDRRSGLQNLFWLAQSRDVAECLREFEAKNPAVRKLKYSLHPLLSSVYRRAAEVARREMEAEDPAQTALLTGERENQSLADSVIDDGFAFTELTISDLDFNLFLAANKRYRLSADLFFEIYSILIRETERRLREQDRGLMARIGRHMPRLSKEQCLSQSGSVKVMMNTHVLGYLLADSWNTGSRLMASPKIKAELDRRKAAEVMDAFLDLVTNVKRFEILSCVRERVSLLQAFDSDRSIDERVSRGLRLYEFGESAQVVNNAVNATVLFLDLRGFTKTSEGQISERDLTQELYKVFDAFVPVVRRFAGTIDKFLGDGIMITFGATHVDPMDPLNAVRTAILCQEVLRGMRDEGRTYFKMGVAIHYGRVYLARFIADERSVQSTVIGRNVNLAGRLSSAAKKALDEDESLDGAQEVLNGGSGLRVIVDEAGTLHNEGIVISRDTLVQLETHLPLVRTEVGGVQAIEYFDEMIRHKIVIHYAGDAKFKGVRSSFPVYDVDSEA
jgi:class 3 adenylate cyclase